MSQKKPEMTSTETFSVELVGSSGASGGGLTVLWSPDRAAHHLTVYIREPLIVGRQAGAGGVTLADRKLSRQHFVIRPVGEGYELVDLASKNGTFVDGLEARGVPLQAGAIIRAGKTLFVFDEDGVEPAHLERFDPDGVKKKAPPRVRDIPRWVRHFKPNLELDANTMDALLLYPWPGGVRELETLCQGDLTQLPGSVTDHVEALRRGVLSRSAPNAQPLDPEQDWPLRLKKLWDPEGETLILDRETGVLQVPGEDEPLVLHTRPVVERLVHVLVDQRLDHPGVLLDSEALIEAVWPGERILHKAAMNRLYKTLSILRKLGLRELLLSQDGNYGLEPEVLVLEASPV